MREPLVVVDARTTPLTPTVTRTDLTWVHRGAVLSLGQPLHALFDAAGGRPLPMSASTLVHARLLAQAADRAVLAGFDADSTAEQTSRVLAAAGLPPRPWRAVLDLGDHRAGGPGRLDLEHARARVEIRPPGGAAGNAYARVIRALGALGAAESPAPAGRAAGRVA